MCLEKERKLIHRERRIKEMLRDANTNEYVAQEGEREGERRRRIRIRHEGGGGGARKS